MIERTRGPGQLEMRYWPHQCVRGHPKPRHAVVALVHVNLRLSRLSVTVIVFTLAHAPLSRSIEIR